MQKLKSRGSKLYTNLSKLFLEKKKKKRFGLKFSPKRVNPWSRSTWWDQAYSILGNIKGIPVTKQSPHTRMCPGISRSHDYTPPLLIQRRRGKIFPREWIYSRGNVHKSSPPFSFPPLMRAAPWIYGIPNAVRPNLLVSWRGGRKGSPRCRCLFVQIATGRTGSRAGDGERERDHLVRLPHPSFRKLGPLFVTHGAKGINEILPCVFFHSQKSRILGGEGKRKVEMVPLAIPPPPSFYSYSSSSHQTFVFLSSLFFDPAWISPIFISLGQRGRPRGSPMWKRVSRSLIWRWFIEISRGPVVLSSRANKFVNARSLVTIFWEGEEEGEGGVVLRGTGARRMD